MLPQQLYHLDLIATDSEDVSEIEEVQVQTEERHADRSESNCA